MSNDGANAPTRENPSEMPPARLSSDNLFDDLTDGSDDVPGG